MPTGYTAAVQDGSITTLRDYALQCARGFGAFLHMHDEPFDTPLTLPPPADTSYYDKRIAEAERILALPLADLGPAGWRLVFLVGLAAVPLIISGSRHLPESGRFAAMVADDRESHPRRIRGTRFALLAGMFLLINVFVAPASQLQNDYLRTERGFSGALITLLVLSTSTPAAIGVLAGGRLADTRSRRWTIIPGLVATAVFGAAFFAVGGAAMWLTALLASVLGALTIAPLGVLGPELFPTARRSGARGGLNAIAVIGSVIGLLGAGALSDQLGFGAAFALLAIGPVVAAVMALAVPETSGRELEDLNR